MELSAGNGIVGVRLSEFVMTRFASKASTSGRGLLTFIQSFELSFSVRALLRLSPPPWTVEELEACFVVTDNAVQKLAYVYFEDESGDARRPSSSAKMRREGLQRISPSCRSYWKDLCGGDFYAFPFAANSRNRRSASQIGSDPSTWVVDFSPRRAFTVRVLSLITYDP
jgi:hypothetical protein